MFGRSSFTRRKALSMASLAGVAGIAGMPALAADNRAALAREAYIWGYPLVQTRLSVKLLRQRGLSFNQLYVAPRIAKPGDKGAAGPNVDTLYGVAWLDLKAGPQVFSVPDTHDRYYVVQLIDAYADNFRDIGRRTTGTHAGHFAIAGPDWRGAVPDGVTLITAPTDTVTAVTRTLVDGPSDLPAALAVQSGYSLTPLSNYPKIARPAQPLENPISLVPTFDLAGLGLAYFDELGAALIDDPPLASDRAFVKRLSTLGIGPGLHPSVSDDREMQGVLRSVIAGADLEVHRRFDDATSDVNGWRVRYKVDEFAPNPLERAARVAIGVGLNLSKEAIYFIRTKGPDGQALDGNRHYVLNFPAGDLPPVEAFWSLTLYGADWYLQANPIDRYSIGDRTHGLRKESDGALRIHIQHEVPASGTANWLPAPAGPFMLVFRAYQPRVELIDGRYRPPPLANA